MEKRLSVFSSRKKKEEKKQKDVEIQLRQACSEEPPSLDKIRPLVAQYPAACKAKDEDGERPLHLVCWKGASLEVVQFLVHSWQFGVRAKTNRQWIPLHYACFANSSSLEVIQYLVQQCWPESVQQIDNRNRLPLHLACFSGTPLTTIQFLVKQWPDSIQQQDNGGSLPLHLACDNKAPLPVIQWLVAQWPPSIQKPNHYASLPLHRACFSLAPLDVVDYLLDEYPQACHATTLDGDLPLHLAAGSGASLQVVQHVARAFPDAIFRKNKENKTPLDMAQQPFTFYKPSPQVVNWLQMEMMKTNGGQNVGNGAPPTTQESTTLPTSSTRTVPTSNSETITAKAPVQASPKQQQQPHHHHHKHGPFEKEQEKLLQVVKGQRDKPVRVSSKYSQFIIKEQLGKGFFGIVYKGVDNAIDQKFAVKCIDKDAVVVHGNGEELLEQRKSEFQKEQRALLHYRHPNIALLYGYYMSESSRKTPYYLLYQLGEKGSLDYFWNSAFGRERLSYFPRRVQIALDAWIGLRFLHVGNRHVHACCHGDVKSANIVLQRDWTAQLIDVGLGTLLHSCSSSNNHDLRNSTVMMSAGVKGTRGYVCPKYCTGSISYEPACDVFSFGVVLAELWSGTLQNHVDAHGRIYNFFEQYIDEEDEPRQMENDLDPVFGYGVSEELPDYMYDYRDLALDCMARNPEKRPPGEEVMNRLEKIWQVCKQVVNEEESVFEDDRTIADAEGFSESLQSVANLGGADPSACRLCRTYATEVGFEECPLCIALQQQRLRIAVAVSSKLDAHSVAPTNRTFHTMRAENRSLQNIRQEQRDSSLPVLSRLDLRLNNSVPRLFLVVPANLRDGWKHPKTWLRRRVATKYHLYFICGQTYQAMKPPIKFTASQEWMDKISLSLGVSLTLLQIAARKGFEMRMKLGGVGETPLVVGPNELSEMLTEVKHILDEGDYFDVLGRIRSGTRLSDKDIQALNGETHELIVERAHEDRGWRTVMSPARKGGESNILWVCDAATEDSRNEYEVIVV